MRVRVSMSWAGRGFGGDGAPGVMSRNVDAAGCGGPRGVGLRWA